MYEISGLYTAELYDVVQFRPAISYMAGYYTKTGSSKGAIPEVLHPIPFRTRK